MPVLTPLVIKQAPARDGRYEIGDAIVPGLHVSITPSGHRSFVVRQRFNGVQVKTTLGTFPAMTLETARDKARSILENAAKGIDPRHGKHGGDGSVAALAIEYDKHTISTLRKGTQALKRRVMAAIVKAWGTRQAASLTRRDVMTLAGAVQPYSSHTYNTRAKGIASFLSWCVQQGHLESNPADRIKKIKVESRDRVLSDTEIAAVWHKATEVNGRLGALAKLLLLTGMRRDECASLRWSEVGKDCIELPASRTKTHTAYDVAITPAVRAVLDGCPQGGEFVLNGKFKTVLSNGARAKLNPEGVPHWTLHDLRRTFTTGCAKLGIAPHIIERCLNHNKKSAVSSIYNRFSYRDEMRAAWELWATHIEKITAS